MSDEDLVRIIGHALIKNEGLDGKLKISDENKKLIAQFSDGDARNALNILDVGASLSEEGELTRENILQAIQKSFLKYDKTGEEHYNIISALHKSMRDSDVQASVYWTMRMIEAGEDPKYIVRRMIRFASEDIGLADSNALQLAIAVKDAVMFLGYPECDVHLVHLAVYLARAPKSNTVYEAVLSSRKDIQETGTLPVPMHLRNAPTKLMKEIGYGKEYKYAHDYQDAKVEQEHLPDKLGGKRWFEEK